MRSLIKCEIIKLNYQDSWAYVQRGYARHQGDNKGAIADANFAIKLDPNLPESYNLRSQVRRSLGDNQGAIADKQKAALDQIEAEDPS